MEVEFNTSPSLVDVLAIAPHMRREDIEEVISFGQSPTTALTYSWENSDDCAVVTIDGVIACALGVMRSGILGNSGMPWFLTTDVLNSFSAQKELLKHSPQVVSVFMNSYDKLHNYVDARYEKAIRWLKWLGFEVGPEIYNPLTGGTLRRFVMEKQING